MKHDHGCQNASCSVSAIASGRSYHSACVNSPALSQVERKLLTSVRSQGTVGGQQAMVTDHDISPQKSFCQVCFVSRVHETRPWMLGRKSFHCSHCVGSVVPLSFGECSSPFGDRKEAAIVKKSLRSRSLTFVRNQVKVGGQLAMITDHDIPQQTGVCHVCRVSTVHAKGPWITTTPVVAFQPLR